jgi:ribosomal protection tetracycline resistance protein
VPVDTVAATLAVLRRLRAVPLTQTRRERAYVVQGEIPAARVHELSRELPGLSHGDGVLESSFGRYQPVTGPTPTRPRTDHNPLDRQEYLLHAKHRV